MAKVGKEKVKIIVLAVIILIALGFIIRQVGPPTLIGVTYPTILVDVEARRIFRAEVRPGVEFPIESPYSPGRNAYPALKCIRDRTIFAFVCPIDETLPEEILMARHMELTPPTCPICGSIKVIIPTIPEGVEFLEVDQEEIPIVKP